MNGYEIPVPAIRERREQIPYFCEMFLKQFAERNPITAVRFAPGILQLLTALSWKGNLREIRNAIEHGAIECLGPEIQLTDLPFRIQQEIKVIRNSHQIEESKPEASDLNKMSVESATGVLKQALERNGHNRAKTARDLGVSRMTIYNWMKRLALEET